MILVSVYEIWQTQIRQTRKLTLLFRKIFRLLELLESMRVDALIDNITSTNVYFSSTKWMQIIIFHHVIS